MELARGRKRRAGNEVHRGQSVPDDEPTFMEPLANTGKRTKTCSLCFQQGHTVRHCPSLEPYKGIPLQKDNREARSELAVNLSQPNTYTTGPLSSQTVYKSLPTGVQALIIHQRMLIDSTLLTSLVPSNFCFECTILHAGGAEHERYTRTAFHLGCIAKHITNNKQNIVISELNLLSGGLGLGLAGGTILADQGNAYLPFLSQLSQQSGLLTTQPSYTQHLDIDIDGGDGPEPIGYGLL
jgi:hypothetical protein